MYTGLFKKCHLLIYSSIEWFNRVVGFFTSQSTTLAYVSKRLNVSSCNLSSSSMCPSINFCFKWQLLDNWSKLKIFLKSVPHNAFYQNCTNGSTPLNKRAARPIDITSFKHHFLNHWSKFKIISHKCALCNGMLRQKTTKKLGNYYILFTKSRGYSNIKNYNIYQTNVINLKQLVLISKVISQSMNKIFKDYSGHMSPRQP